MRNVCSLRDSITPFCRPADRVLQFLSLTARAGGAERTEANCQIFVIYFIHTSGDVTKQDGARCGGRGCGGKVERIFRQSAGPLFPVITARKLCLLSTNQIVCIRGGFLRSRLPFLPRYLSPSAQIFPLLFLLLLLLLPPQPIRGKTQVAVCIAMQPFCPHRNKNKGGMF